MKNILLSTAVATTLLLQGCATEPDATVKNKSSVIGNHQEGFQQFSIATFSADYVQQRIEKDMARMAIEHRREGNVNVVTVNYNNLLSATKYIDAGKFKISIAGKDILDAIALITKDVTGSAVRVDAHINPSTNDIHDARMVKKLISAMEKEIGDTDGKVTFTNKGGYRPLFQNKKDFFNPNNRVEFVFYSYEL
jgi:outer membrane protein OmpA-like peptidoglycan-associated protein